MAGFSTAPGTYVSNYNEITSEYIAVTNGTGFNIGDVIQKTEIINPATTPPTLLKTQWNNLTTQLAMLTGPAASDIDPGSVVTTKGLTVISFEYLYQGVPLPDFAVGDLVQVLSTYDTSENPPLLVSTVYNNISQGAYNVAAAFSAYDLVPVKNVPYQVITSSYIATADSPGRYSIGDILERRVSVDYSNAALPQVGLDWFNVTQIADIAGIALQSEVVPVESQTPTSFSVITNNYYAIATVAGEYTIGDVVQNEQKLDTSVTPPTIASSTWVNLTTGNPMLTPLQANILPVDTPAGSGTVTGAGTVTNQYLVITGTPEASPGDVVEEVISYNLGVTPPAPVGSKWTNVTTGLAITVPNTPDYVDLAPFGSADANTTRVSSSALYVAIADSTPAGSYVVGDTIQRVTIFNTNEDPPTTVSDHFDNLTTGVENIVADYNEITPLGGPVPNPAFIDSRQLTTAIAPVQAPNQPYQNGVVITADGANLQTIYLGGDNTLSTTTGYPLVPGQSMSYGVSNLNAIWYLGLNATDKLFVSGN